MTISVNDRTALEELDSRLKIILPEEYQDSYEDVQPVSMGSAGLKYAKDGKVAWNEIWDTFCDLALAGGPPHKGALLEPASRAEINARPDRYREVVEEICRGIMMVTQLPADPAPMPGWCRVVCYSDVMAGWLLRAIVVENVAARSEGIWLDLPAAPSFRLEKEIKNVITVIAKTCHYWTGHMSRSQQRAVAALFATLTAESPLVTAAMPDADVTADSDANAAAVADRIHRDSGLASSRHHQSGWLGVPCPSVRAAIWMMRAMVVSNVLSRREGSVLLVPINAVSDPGGEHVSSSLARIHRLAVAREIL